MRGEECTPIDGVCGADIAAAALISVATSMNRSRQSIALIGMAKRGKLKLGAVSPPSVLIVSHLNTGVPVL